VRVQRQGAYLPLHPRESPAIWTTLIQTQPLPGARHTTLAWCAPRWPTRGARPVVGLQHGQPVPVDGAAHRGRGLDQHHEGGAGEPRLASARESYDLVLYGGPCGGSCDYGRLREEKDRYCIHLTRTVLGRL
jgi:hypothetical protein